MRFIESIASVLLIGIFVFTSCISCSTVMNRSVLDKTSQELSVKNYLSIAKILVISTKNKPVSIGTAFAINDEYLATAGHNCEQLTLGIKAGQTKPVFDVIRSDAKGRSYKQTVAEIVKIHPKHDLCLLRAKNHHLVPLKILEDYDLLQVEDLVSVIGAPSGYFPVKRYGHIISLYESDFSDEEMLFLSIDIQGGNSGGPVLWNGYVIGVIVMLPYTLHNSGLAVRGDILKEFIQQQINTRSK